MQIGENSNRNVKIQRTRSGTENLIAGREVLEQGYCRGIVEKSGVDIFLEVADLLG